MDYICIFKKIIITILILIAFIFVCKLSVFYIPFLIAYIISLLIEPAIKFIKRKTNFTRKTSSIIVLITIFSVLVGLLVWGLISLVSETTNLLSGLNIYLEKGIFFIQNISKNFKIDGFKFPEEVKKIGESAATNLLNSITNKIKELLTQFLEYISSIPNLLIYIIITILATYFITSDKFYILDRMEHHLSKKMVGKMIKHTKEITTSLGNYLKAQIILILISFCIILLGLNLFKITGLNIKYPVIMAIVIGFVDALPILGTGAIMVPWIIWSFMNSNYNLGFCLLGLYIFTIVTRQLLEPKIVSNKIGIHPIFTLIAMYTGFKIIGIIGMLLGPIILIILKNIFAENIDKGLLTAMTDLD